MTQLHGFVLLACCSFLLAPTSVVATGPCDADSSPALGLVELSLTGDASTTFYVQEFNAEYASLWQESNGIFVGGDVARDFQGDCNNDGTIQPDSRVI